MKKQLVTEKKMLLFIDTGDNCRCPMAAGYLQRLLDQRGIKYIEIKTAGVMTPTGLLPTPEAVQLLDEEHVNIRRHRSTPLSIDMIKRADLILGMTPFHVQRAIRQAEEARGKTFLLKEYVGREGRNTQIADPMGGTLEIFKKCFAEIKASLSRLAEMEFVTEPPAPKERVIVDTTPAALRDQLATAQEAMKEARAKQRPKAAPKVDNTKLRPMAAPAKVIPAPPKKGAAASSSKKAAPATAKKAADTPAAEEKKPAVGKKAATPSLKAPKEASASPAEKKAIAASPAKKAPVKKTAEKKAPAKKSK